MSLSTTIEGLLTLLPDAPGVYLMKDEDERVIYVGKAKSLKKRVSQYFLRPQEGKVAAMVAHVSSFDFILVGSEKEAFILEMNLIKEKRPRYNIQLMDDSHYPYIALRKKDLTLSLSHDKKDRSRVYFGPYPNRRDAHRTIALLDALYPTRKCRVLGDRPCIYRSMGQCLAPCVSPISPDKADEIASSIHSFLLGKVGPVKASIEHKLQEAAEELRYEDAARYKGLLDAIGRTTLPQSVELTSEHSSMDVFAIASRDGYLAVALLTYRRGLLLGKEAHVVPLMEKEAEEAFDLIASHYAANELPGEIVLNLPSFDEAFSALYPGAKITHPKEGRLMEALSLASLNARKALDAHFLSARLEDKDLASLEELGRLLGIKTPYAIELFDNSHLQGSYPVAAMVHFLNGKPFKAKYRRYHLSEEHAGDDFASMREAVGRRYRRLLEEGEELPDLLLADGGLPQVEATLLGLSDAGASLPVFGLYKNDRHETEGLIGPDGAQYAIDRKSPLFFLLMRMQDEVHRFAISFHKSLRLKGMGKSLYDGIPGIGKKRKALLERAYPTKEALLSASLEELSQFLPKDVAERVHRAVRDAPALAGKPKEE